MIRELEQLGMDAWPALDSVAADGWTLRFSDGYTRRANSVHPLDSGVRELEAKIDEAERLYAERGLPTIFKLTEASLPEGLDRALATRGYLAEARTSVRIADLPPRKDPGGVEIETFWRSAVSWREALPEIVGVAPERRLIHERIVGSIPAPTAFALVRSGEAVVGCGLGVLQGAWLGVFDVAVAGSERRRGHGERLMQGLLSWGRRKGARRAYLQVMHDNGPALALYDKLGFREAYAYWYRVKR